MADNPNANYDEILDGNHSVFPSVYDDVMEQVGSHFGLPKELREILDKKRKFGLEKYGERAFQSSFENAVASPVAAHLGDEIVDAFNYALHGYYIASVTMNNHQVAAYANIIQALKKVALYMEDLSKILPDGPQREQIRWVEDQSWE